MTRIHRSDIPASPRMEFLVVSDPGWNCVPIEPQAVNVAEA